MSGDNSSSGKEDLVFNSKPSIMTLSLNNKSVTFNNSCVAFRFEHQDNLLGGTPHCVFWDADGDGFWSEEGCQVLS